MKIIPWVDVTCSICGTTATGSGYYYRGIIKKLQDSKKNWHSDGCNIYCPDCWKEIKED